MTLAEQLSLDLETEAWRPVPGVEPYEVSNMGRVRNGETGRVLKPWKTHSNSREYWRVELKRKKHRVHTLVLAAFIGPRPSGHECAHHNGDSLDNRLCNLRWATPQENRADGERHGTMKAYTRRDYKRALRLRGLGWTQKEVAADIGCTDMTISNWERGTRLPWR